MEKGTSVATRMIDKELDEETKSEIDLIVKEIPTYNVRIPRLENEALNLLPKLTEEEIMTIKGYTGLNSKNMNALLRNRWDYEVNGKRTKELENRIQQDVTIMDTIFSKLPKTEEAIVAYRGTTLSEFKKYGITSLEELVNLKGKFLYEVGYTSTSLYRDSSYYNKEILNSLKNIQTRYIIPPNSQDGIPLISDVLSYSPNQQEYLINRSSLSKVIDVKIENDTAVITAVLIPSSIINKKIMLKEKENENRMIS